MAKILLFRCCPTGQPKAADDSTPPPLCTACGKPMAPTVCLNDGTIQPGEYQIRCIRPKVPQRDEFEEDRPFLSRNPEWELEEEVWVVGNGRFDGGEQVGWIGKGRLAWEGVPVPGLPGGSIAALTRHGAARKLAAKLTDQL